MIPIAPETEQKLDVTVLRACVLAGLTLSALCVLVPNLPGKDTAMYYSRMARAFAEGHYSGAFYHMIPPLFPVLAGLVAKLGLDAYTAAKLVSCLLHVLGVPVVFALAGTVGTQREARWATVLYLVCPRLLRYSGNAGPDSGKTLLLMLLALCMVRHYRSGRLRWIVGGALAGGALALMRSEGLILTLAAPAVIVLRAARVADGKAAWRRAVRCGLHALLFGSIVFGVLLPWMAYQRRVTGYWLTDSRQLRVLTRAGLVAPSQLARFQQSSLEGIEKNLERNRFGPLRPFGEAAKGLVPAYLILAAIGLWTRRRRETRWSVEETVFLGVIALNFLIFYAVSGYVTKRYVSATLPFILAWSAPGFLALGVWLDRLRPGKRGPARAVAAVFLAVCVWDGLSNVRPSSSARKRAAERLPREIAAWIDQRRSELTTGRSERLASSEAWYHDGQLPVLLAADPRVAYLAHTDLVPVASLWVYTPEAVLGLCRSKGVSLVLLCPALTSVCPGIADAMVPEAGFTKRSEWSVGETCIELLAFDSRVERSGGGVSAPPAEPDGT